MKCNDTGFGVPKMTKSPTRNCLARSFHYVHTGLQLCNACFFFKYFCVTKFSFFNQTNSWWRYVFDFPPTILQDLNPLHSFRLNCAIVIVELNWIELFFFSYLKRIEIMSGLVCDSRKINSECVSQMDAWADTQIRFNSSAIVYGQTQTMGASYVSTIYIQLHFSKKNTFNQTWI